MGARNNKYKPRRSNATMQNNHEWQGAQGGQSRNNGKDGDIERAAIPNGELVPLKGETEWGAQGNEEHQELRPSDTSKEISNEENQTTFETSMKWLSVKKGGLKGILKRRL